MPELSTGFAGSISAGSALSHLLFALLLFAVSAALTRLMIRLNITDTPNWRSSHTLPTPKSGGVAIAGSFFSGMALLYYLSGTARLPAAQFLTFIVTSGVLFGVSLFDDLVGLRPWMKLAAQFACASLFNLFVAHLDLLAVPFLGNISFGVFGYVLSVFWMMFFMNAFNFMDGVNGLAGGGALIASAFLALIALFSGAHFVYLSALCLFASILGFFVYNFPHGRIFMGDTGSQIIGFVFSGLALIGARADLGQVSVIIVPTLFGCFIFDVAATLVYRFMRGKNLTEAHREHLYQIFNRLGFSHKRVSALYFALFTVSGISAAFIQMAAPSARPALFIGLVAMFTPLAILVYGAGMKQGIVDLQADPA